MSGAVHTPGPWEWVVKNGEYYTLGPADDDVLWPCSEQGNYGLSSREYIEVSEANARLIASAPALLEALEEARLQLIYLDEKHGTGTTPAVLARVNYAIAQARGAA